MRLLLNEFGHEYDSYSFGYTVHGELEPSDSLENVYADGFLPYASSTDERALFYMSRSVRVPVSAFVPSSENRRIFRKFDEQFTVSILDRDVVRSSEHLSNLFLDYFKGRHGEQVMPAERLARILARDLPLRATAYAFEGTIVAYVLEVAEGSFSHYWYSCYDLSYANTSLGMWLMLDIVRRASTEDRSHVYLGTAYGEKAKYKTNVPGLEFWNGNEWVADTVRLQTLMRNDTSH